MRPRCLFPLLILCGSSAGCFDDRGVALEIDLSAAPTTKSVEMFLSTVECDLDDCHAIKPEGASRLAGEVWHRDSRSRIRADLNGHKATFRIEADADTSLRRVIVIATDSAGKTTGDLMMTDLVVPANDAKLIEVSLVKAGQIGDPAATDSALLWETPDHGTSCGVAAHLDNVGVPTRVFIVPDGDEDCDGYVGDADCAPSAYMSPGPVPGASSSCLYHDATNIGPCIVGVAGCVFTGGPETCAPQAADPVCVPSRVCEVCDNAMSFGKCEPPFNGDMPRIECTVPTMLAGDCNDRSEIVMPSLFGDCGAAKIAPFKDDGSAEIDVRDFETKAMFGAAEIDVDLDAGPCTLRLTRKGADRAVTVGPPELGLIQFDSGHGSTVVPLVMTFQNVCGPAQAGLECHLAPSAAAFNNDPMWDCTAP